MDVFTIDPSADGGYLPAFSFREEAETFLCLLAQAGGGRGWKIRETSAEELVSVLYGPCAGVKKVALDPPVPHGAMLGLVGMDRERFLRYLLGEGREAAQNRSIWANLAG